MRARRIPLIVIVAQCLLGASLSYGDTWGAPKEEHWSTNGEYVLKVACNSSKPKGISLWHKTEQGLAELWTRGYVDETWPPHMAYVANDGQHVVLRDVHGSLGHGKSLVFLGSQGEVIRAYELSDFLTDDEILRTKMTVSSRWWSDPGWFALRDGDRQFALVSSKGTIRCFDITTGAPITLDESLKAQITSEACADNERLLSDPEPRQRALGAELLGLLGAIDRVPALTKLLQDENVTYWSGSGSKMEPMCGVKLAAAEALVRLIGAQALPLIESELEKANDGVCSSLLRILSGGDHLFDYEMPGLRRRPMPRDVWERLARSKREMVRSHAMIELLKDDGAYLRAHPELMKSEMPGVRYAAVRTLSEHGKTEDIPLLREALRDSDDSIALWAWRTLIKLNPPDVRKLLDWGRKQRDPTIQFEAILELARRGDADAIKRVLSGVNAFREHSHQREGWGTDEFDAEDMCQLVAEMKLREAEPGLRAALQTDCEDLKRSVCGALAALGDAEARNRIREYARKGAALDRASAIRWIGLIGDTESIPFLEESTKDEEPWIREAATEALGKLKAADK